MARHTYTGRYYVGDDTRSFPTAEGAASFAQLLACRAKKDCTFYVREEGTQGFVTKVEKRDGIVHTQRMR